MAFSVTRPNARPALIGVGETFDTLAPETDIYDLMTRLKRRERVAVVFKDGTHGVLAFPELDFPPERQTSLVLVPRSTWPTPHHRRFRLGCKLVVEIEMQIECKARDKRHAQSIVTDVFHQIEPVPAGFSVSVNHDELQGLFADLITALGTEDLRRLEPYQVQFDTVEEAYQELTYAPDVSFPAETAG